MSDHDWQHEPEPVRNPFADLTRQLEELKADPRLACPLDGPGSHRADLAELRVLTSQLATARADAVHWQKEWETTKAQRDSMAALLLEWYTAISQLPGAPKHTKLEDVLRNAGVIP